MNPDCDRAYQQAKAQGKKLGFYHYAREKGYKGSAADEARFFIDSCRNYFGEAIPVLDWRKNCRQAFRGLKNSLMPSTPKRA